MFGETLNHSFYIGVGIRVPACVMGQHLFSGSVNLPLQVTYNTLFVENSM